MLSAQFSNICKNWTTSIRSQRCQWLHRGSNWPTHTLWCTCTGVHYLTDGKNSGQLDVHIITTNNISLTGLSDSISITTINRSSKVTHCKLYKYTHLHKPCPPFKFWQIVASIRKDKLCTERQEIWSWLLMPMVTRSISELVQHSLWCHRI